MCNATGQCVPESQKIPFYELPTNFDPNTLTPPSGEVMIPAGTSASFNTSSNTFGGNWGSILPSISTVTLSNGQTAVVLATEKFTLGYNSYLRITGSRPIIFAAFNQVTINGTIDASAKHEQPGPGGDHSGCTVGSGGVGGPGQSQGWTAGGGGGAGAKTNGGNGGSVSWGGSGGPGGGARGAVCGEAVIPDIVACCARWLKPPDKSWDPPGGKGLTVTEALTVLGRKALPVALETLSVGVDSFERQRALPLLWKHASKEHMPLVHRATAEGMAHANGWTAATYAEMLPKDPSPLANELWQMLGHSQKPARDAAVIALTRLGEKAIPTAAELLQDKGQRSARRRWRCSVPSAAVRQQYC